MRAATKARMMTERMIRIMATIMLVLVISIGFLVPKAAAQSDQYPKMAPVDQYLMEKNAEILLARSAAPDSISSDATVLILGRQGYETAVQGKNGFVCMVERSWMAQFDSPEFWNPKIRGAECLNRQAARSIVPSAELRTRMVMAGHSKAEIVSALKAAFDKKQLPGLENGNMVFMMSKSAYLYDAGDHNGPHLMFFTTYRAWLDETGAVQQKLMRHAHVSTTMDQYGNASAMAKRKANRPIVQRLLRRSANQQQIAIQ
jgi:hypothetical protein